MSLLSQPAWNCGAAAALAAIAVLGSRLPAQGLTTNPATLGHWEVQSIADLDLWFHGLALIGYSGNGPIPLYENGYAARIRAAKAGRKIGSTLLDRNAESLNRAFRRDNVFELLHFLPLYFLDPDQGNLFPALRAVARGESPGRATADSSRTAVLAAIARVLQTDEQRRLLTKYLDALEDERQLFYDEYARESLVSRQISAEQAGHYWVDKVIPRIAPFLDRVGAPSGILILSPTLGAEGRSIQLPGPNGGMAIVAVGLPSSAADFMLPAAAAVRELCFPIVNLVIASQPSPGASRITQERLSSRAAVRCGAHAVEQLLPSLLVSYQTLFLRGAGPVLPARALDAAFAEAFPISSRIDEGIRRALNTR